MFHCPYCDGFEVDGAPIGVLGNLPLSVHFATIVRDWGGETLFTNGTLELTDSEREALARREIRVETAAITELSGPSDRELDRVLLADGRRITVGALFIATRFRQAAPFAEQLCCEILSTPRGPLIKTDESKMTSVSGVYAAGDMSRPTHGIPFATADGVTAGVAAH